MLKSKRSKEIYILQVEYGNTNILQSLFEHLKKSLSQPESVYVFPLYDIPNALENFLTGQPLNDPKPWNWTSATFSLFISYLHSTLRLVGNFTINEADMNAPHQTKDQKLSIWPECTNGTTKNKQQQQHNAKQILYHFLVHRCVGMGRNTNC